MSKPNHHYLELMRGRRRDSTGRMKTLCALGYANDLLNELGTTRTVMMRRLFQQHGNERCATQCSESDCDCPYKNTKCKNKLERHFFMIRTDVSVTTGLIPIQVLASRVLYSDSAERRIALAVQLAALVIKFTNIDNHELEQVIANDILRTTNAYFNLRNRGFKLITHKLILGEIVNAPQ